MNNKISKEQFKDFYTQDCCPNCGEDDNEDGFIPFDYYSTQSKKILNRNEQDWYEFCASFTLEELQSMRRSVHFYNITRQYDLTDCNDISDLIYDYIMYWVFDQINEGDLDFAKEILNEGL